MTRSRSRTKKDVSSSSFRIAKYTALGFVSIEFIWVIFFGIIKPSDPCFVTDTTSTTTNSPNVNDIKTIVFVGMSFAIVLLFMCLASLIAQLIVIICEVFWAVVTIAVLHGLGALCMLIAISCTAWYVIHLILGLITMGAMIWYSLELYKAQKSSSRGKKDESTSSSTDTNTDTSKPTELAAKINKIKKPRVRH